MDTDVTEEIKTTMNVALTLLGMNKKLSDFDVQSDKVCVYFLITPFWKIVTEFTPFLKVITELTPKIQNSV